MPTYTSFLSRPRPAAQEVQRGTPWAARCCSAPQHRVVAPAGVLVQPAAQERRPARVAGARAVGDVRHRKDLLVHPRAPPHQRPDVRRVLQVQRLPAQVAQRQRRPRRRLKLP